MKLTKTWLSYIVWGFFSIIFFTNIGIAAIEIYIKNEMNDFLMPMLIMYGGTILGILLLIGLYKLYEKFILPKITEGETAVLQGALEWLALALVIFVAIAVRAMAIIAATGQLEGTTEYFDYAISYGNSGSFNVHNNGSYLYSGILGFILGFLGHIPAAAMAVQAGIQVITILATYFMMKKSLGRLPAWIAVVLLSFLPGSFLMVRTCTPDALFTMFFSLYLLALVYLCEANREQKIRIGAHILFYVLIGVFAAFLAYLDMAGLIALVIGIVAIVQSKNAEAWLKIQKPILQVPMFVGAFVFALVLLLWFIPAGDLVVGPDAVIAYVTSFIPGGGLNIMIMSPHKGQWDCIALFIFAGLWFVGFLRNKQDKAFPYAILIVFLTIMSFLGIGAYEYTWYASYLWIMLATIGISSINIFRKSARDVAVAEKNKENTAKRKAERERKRSEAAGEKSIRLDDVSKKKAPEEPAYEKRDAYASSQAKAGNVSSYDSSEKKSYGIGRKADSPVSAYENNKEEAVPGANVQSNMTKSMVNTEPSGMNRYAANVSENKTVVKKVDRPPLATPPAPAPVVSKPSYSQGSRSRRSLRSPSKSTFTPEDLERISRYTGVSYITAQTVQPEVEEPAVESFVNDVFPANNFAVTQTVETSNVAPVVETTAPAVEASAVEQTVAEEYNPAVAGVAETLGSEVINDTTEEATTSADAGGYIELDAEENDVKENTEEPVSEQAAEAIEKPVQLAPYVSPSRRHFRHPSKSTFSQEELEKISQYTGVDYKKSSVKEETAVVENKAPEKTVETVKTDDVQSMTSPKAEAVQTKEDRVGDKPAVIDKSVEMPKTKNVAASKTTTSDAIDIKSNPDRKPKMIRNPLPGPKPHVAKELNYDYIPKESEMDFDIVDLKGKDFFDF